MRDRRMYFTALCTPSARSKTSHTSPKEPAPSLSTRSKSGICGLRRSFRRQLGNCSKGRVFVVWALELLKLWCSIEDVCQISGRLREILDITLELRFYSGRATQAELRIDSLVDDRVDMVSFC